MLPSSVVDKWLDLLTPSAAALAILFAVALVIQSIRHGRALRRLEGRLAEREGAGARVSLDRLRELQQRRTPSVPAEIPDAAVADAAIADDADDVHDVEDLEPERPVRTGARGPRWQPIVAAVAVLAVVAGTVSYLFLRGDDGNAANEPTTTLVQTGTSTANSSKTLPTPNQVVTTVPDTPKNLAGGKGAYVVKVLNGTAITGVAGYLTPRIGLMGYQTVDPTNAAAKDIAKSFVVYTDTSKIDLAQNLAKDLGITEIRPLDGVQLDSADDAVGVDALVVVGNDALAQKYRP